MMIKFLKIFIFFAVLCGRNAQADDFLPDFSFPDTEDKTHAISEWKGKRLVINFWATWCQPCLKEIPEFMLLQTQYSKQNVQFIGIAIDDASAVLHYKQAIGVNYPLLVSSEWEGFDLSAKLGNAANTVPFTLVVDSDGKIIYRYAGAVKKNELVSVLSLKK